MNDQRQKNNATTIMLLVLFGCAIGGMAGLAYFADQYNWVREGAISTGLSGGALGCGIFAATALYGIVKIFISKTN